MERFALQPGITAGLCPYGHTDCVPAADAVAQRIRQLEQQLTEAKQQLSVKDDQLMLQGRQLILQSEQLISQNDQIRSKDERIKQLSGQSASPAKAAKKRRRATQKEVENRHRIIAAAVAEITLTYERLPSVSEVAEKTALTQQQIYGSPSYKEGRIARASAVITEAMTGSSIQKTEYYSETSEEHCRRKSRSKAEQAELEALIDQQTADDNSQFAGT